MNTKTLSSQAAEILLKKKDAGYSDNIIPANCAGCCHYSSVTKRVPDNYGDRVSQENEHCALHGFPVVGHGRCKDHDKP